MLKKILIILFLILISSTSAWAISDAYIYYQVGSSLYGKGLYLLSIPYYRAVVEADPNNWEAYQALGGCEIQLKQFNSAISDYHKSLTINPNNEQLQSFFNQLSNGLAGQPPSSLTALARSEETFYQAGNTLYNKRYYLLSIPYYKAVVEDDPQNWKAYQALGGCEYQLSRKDDAIRHYRISLAVNPNNKELQTFVDQISASVAAPTASPTPSQVLSQVVVPTATPAAVKPMTNEDSRLPHQGSLTWEIGSAVEIFNFQDLVSDYSPDTLTLPSNTPIEVELDFGADYTLSQSFQLGAQVQYLSKEEAVIYSPYVSSYPGAIATTTWTEACVGGALEGKYLFPLSNQFRLIFEGQAGIYSLTGSTFVYTGSYGENLDLDGTTFGGLLGMELEWVLDNGAWAIDLGVGYRGLTFNSITATSTNNSQSQNFTNVAGGNATIDFSGPRVNLAARFF
jgi:tetratricopeptide (TPR) repeat protein